MSTSKINTTLVYTIKGLHNREKFANAEFTLVVIPRIYLVWVTMNISDYKEMIHAEFCGLVKIKWCCKILFGN